MNLNFKGNGIAGLIYKKFGNRIDERTVKNAKKLENLTTGMVLIKSLYYILIYK
jgi:hypothetical protein